MMRSLQNVTVGLSLLGLASCAHPTTDQSAPPKIHAIHNFKVGPWDNPYSHDPNLAGVEVHQFGECPYDQHLWEGKHPCAIWFFFWDGRVRQCGYEPDGTLHESFWWRNRIKPGDARWQHVDFSQGSDPKFQSHAGPRPQGKKKAS